MRPCTVARSFGGHNSCSPYMTVVETRHWLIPLQAHPYFKLDCNAGGSLHASSLAAQPSTIENSSPGEAVQNLEHIAPTSNGTATSAGSTQAGSEGQGKARQAPQSCSEPADRFSNGSSTCLDGASASAKAMQHRSHGSEGDSAFTIELPHATPTVQLEIICRGRVRVRLALLITNTDMLCHVDIGGGVWCADILSLAVRRG